MSPLLWTPPTPGDCRHGEPASTCPICHPDHSRLDEPAVRVLLVLLLAALLVFGRGSFEVLVLASGVCWVAAALYDTRRIGAAMAAGAVVASWAGIGWLAWMAL